MRINYPREHPCIKWVHGPAKIPISLDTDDEYDDINYTSFSIVIGLGDNNGELLFNENEDGRFTFNPGTDFDDLLQDDVQEISFTYTVNDLSLDSISNISQVRIFVSGINDSPTLSEADPGLSITANEDEGTGLLNLPGASDVDDGVDPDGYSGIISDGKFLYFSPYHNGENFHGEVLRYDTTKDFESVEAWSTFDPSKNGVGYNAIGYGSTIYDGHYIYFSTLIQFDEDE